MQVASFAHCDWVLQLEGQVRVCKRCVAPHGDAPQLPSAQAVQLQAATTRLIKELFAKPFVNINTSG
jgi:lipocalin